MRKKKELATELYLNIRDRSQFFAFEINSLKDFVNKKKCSTQWGTFFIDFRIQN